MEDLDQKIEQALREATGSVEAGPDEASVLQDVAATFRGQYRSLFALAWAKLFAFVALAIWSAYEFFMQTTVQAQIAYATLVVVSAITIASIYTLFWVSMNKQMVSREMKRLELQIALLNNKLETRS